MTHSRQDRPDHICLIIGAMKSGTTSLFNYLADHPQICPSRTKEPDFFALDEVHALGLDWYFELWDWQPASHRIALEASTNYTKRPVYEDPAQRIAAVDGVRFKFIYVMRDPLDRIESQAKYAAYAGREVRGDAYAKTTPRFSRSYSLDDGVTDLAIAFSKYAYQLEPFIDLFPQQDIKLVSFEDLVRDRPAVLRDICAFLEIDPAYEFAADDKVFNESARLARPVDAWMKLRSIKPLEKLAVKAVPPAFRRKVRDALTNRPKGRFKLTPAERSAVLRQLKPDLTRLRDEFGFDAETRWGIDLGPERMHGS